MKRRVAYSDKASHSDDEQCQNDGLCSDDGLRERISKSWSTRNKSGTPTSGVKQKILDRPKTPGGVRIKERESDTKTAAKTAPKTAEKVSTPRHVKNKKSVNIKGASGVLSPQKPPPKTPQKPPPKTPQKTPPKTPQKPSKPSKTSPNTIYLCPVCEKTYKSKNGIIKHMANCR